MKFSQATIAAIVALSSFIGATEPPRRRRSLLQSKSSNAATQTNQNTTASVLAAQTGTDCFLTSTDFTGMYNLVVNNINPVTTLFQERPGRLAGTLSTKNFTATFAENFGADLPNAAVTIMMGGTGQDDNTVFIVTLSDPRMTDAVGGTAFFVGSTGSTPFWIDGTEKEEKLEVQFNPLFSDPSMSVEGGGITYTVAQSSSQAGVLPLESLYERQGTSSDNSCSIFIDGMVVDNVQETLDA